MLDVILHVDLVYAYIVGLEREQPDLPYTHESVTSVTHRQVRARSFTHSLDAPAYHIRVYALKLNKIFPFKRRERRRGILRND